jgi:lactoylglutathione lyase
MKIDHIAIWTHDIERLKAFYERYFEARAGSLYKNQAKQFRSYFLTFASGARLELMEMPLDPQSGNGSEERITGLIHLAISTGSKDGVDDLTGRLMSDGHQVVNGPRTTGDGYYESVVLDPDGNRVEITI